MSRTTRRRAVRAVAPVAGLLAAGLLVWQGSYAAFSATTTSPTNSWATGSVALRNNSNGGTYGAIGTAAFTANNLAPNATAVSKCITVESSGTVAGAVKFYATGVTPSVVGTNQLSANITVTVTEQTAGVGASNILSDCSNFTGTTPIASAALNALPSSYNPAGPGAFNPTGAATQYAAYKISYVFNPGTAVADVQGKTASATFVWEIQST